MDPAQARELLRETQERLQNELLPELDRLQAEAERQKKLVEALLLFVDDEDLSPAEKAQPGTVSIEREEPPRMVRALRKGNRSRHGSTASLVTEVLKDAGGPMSPADVLNELERRDQVPDSQSPASLIGTTLQRLNDRESSQVRRVATGRYAYVVEADDWPAHAPTITLEGEEGS